MALFLGGIFNNGDPIFGFPLYVWGLIAELILIGITWIVLWWAWWKPTTPLHGIYWGWKNMSGAAFICDKNLIAELVPERLAKCIFDYSKEEYEIEVPYANIPIIGRIATSIYQYAFYYPTKYLPDLSPFEAFRYKVGGVNLDVKIAIHLQNGEWDRYPSVVCGGVPVDIVIDTNNWTIPNSKEHLAVERTARKWNKENPHNQIHSYIKFQKYLSNGKIQAPPEIQVEYMVPWTRVDTCFPTDLEENDWGGKRRQMAIETSDKKEMSERWRMAIIILIGGLVFAGIILIIRLILHFL